MSATNPSGETTTCEESSLNSFRILSRLNTLKDRLYCKFSRLCPK
ncbi:unnamed protein product [Moneuplotes crassus]|uniref:Uncharacterized protein n=1 Tax=Euplotes crassus TaxID=5936 RepID=A0AAD2D8K8_EUPCR|nr:unnamed protein product [Moneuplotes crassus]